MSEQDHRDIRGEIKEVGTRLGVMSDTLNVLATETAKTRQAMEFQNGRVTKNEQSLLKINGFLTKLLVGMVLGLLSMVISLVVFIFLNAT